MKAFVKATPQNLNTNYRTVARLIWGVPQEDFWISHTDGNTAFNCLSDFAFSLFPSDFNKDWKYVNARWNASYMHVHKTNDPNISAIFTGFDDELAINQKGFYNLVLYIATKLDGLISEDNRISWISTEQFQNKHRDIMNLPFNLALQKSIDKGRTVLPIPEPDYDQLDYDGPGSTRS